MNDSPPISARILLSMNDDDLVGQCSVDHYRASGPGGQKRNKTSSAVRLRHHATGLSVTASDDRSQRVNRTRAVRRLREAIALHVRAAVDPTRFIPSELFTNCLRDSGLVLSRRHERYFHIVAEVLDVLAAVHGRVSDAARLLGLSTAPLVKFLRNDPKLWDRVNQLRARAGVKPLRSFDS